MIRTIRARRAAAIVVLALGLAGSAHALSPPADDPRALLAAGQALLAARDPQAAFFVLERAAFLAPDDPAIRAALAQALRQLGAADTARHLLGEETPAASAFRRVEAAFGYSTNRSQEPALDRLSLTLPGLPPADYALATPYRPRPGPLLWLGVALRRDNGDTLQARLTAAPDDSLGQFWLLGQKSLFRPGWFLRAEYQQRLDAGRQGALLLRREWSAGDGWRGDAEIGLRTESGLRYLEGRAGLGHASPWGEWRAGLQVSDPREPAAGGRQTRVQFGWGRAIPAGPGQLSLGLAWRASRDARPYHPWIAAGARRWQQAWLAQTVWEMPLDGRRALFVQFTGENNRSNISLFRYRRAELWLGIMQAW